MSPIHAMRPAMKMYCHRVIVRARGVLRAGKVVRVRGILRVRGVVRTGLDGIAMGMVVVCAWSLRCGSPNYD